MQPGRHKRSVACGDLMLEGGIHMEGDWLAASSFERTHEILSAINILSIHAKLHLAGTVDPIDEAVVEQARGRLLEFLTGFGELLQNADQAGAVVGADPRLAELAQRYRVATQRIPRSSLVFELTVGELSDLVRSERAEDLPKLVECLRGLRGLLEQHSVADAVGILGEV